MPDTPQLPAANLLGEASSPYLLQHAANPVHWRPWGEAALAEARRSGKPILLSIGYAACHWCHVMAHESFEDPDTAALMNAEYVNIKVDREERPDIDALYMSALQLMGEPGGWPLTVFLTPDAEPFWGGTYFPPAPRHGQPSFRQVLAGLAEAYRREPDKVTQNSAALRQGLVRLAAASPGPLPQQAQLEAVIGALLRATDPREGGLAGAPKFPNPPLFRFLWQLRFRLGQPACAEAVTLLLRRMSQGGIWDHLAGGFARYSVDGLWLVPHFEKMLYDNAQLLELLALAQAERPDPLFLESATALVGWLEREMLVEGGAFASSQDADSEGEEGRFAVWSAAEVDGLLGPDAALFRRVYDVTEGGNWEGRNILNRRAHPAPLPAAEEAALARARATLFAARQLRVQPGRDDKVLADWNGLAVAALVRAAAVFGRPEWLALARCAFDFVADSMRDAQGRLLHAWRDRRGSAAGLLEDHAVMARAALALFESTGEPALLDQAVRWIGDAEQHFAAPDGGFFASADDAADVLVRGRSAADGVTPSGNGLMAENYARLFLLTGEPAWRSKAEAVIGAFSGDERGLAGTPTLLTAADLLEAGAGVVIAGDPADGAAAALATAALLCPDPAVAVLWSTDPAAMPPGHPAHGKGRLDGAPAAYVCRGSTCSLPVTTPDALATALVRPAPPVTG